MPATASAASPLTFPTLDDFIPPHLQRRPHPSPPASACGSLPPGSHTPPSFSPPPPLVPPAPEDLHSGSEPDLTGAVPSTVSLPAPPTASPVPAPSRRCPSRCTAPCLCDGPAALAAPRVHVPRRVPSPPAAALPCCPVSLRAVFPATLPAVSCALPGPGRWGLCKAEWPGRTRRESSQQAAGGANEEEAFGDVSEQTLLSQKQQGLG